MYVYYYSVGWTFGIIILPDFLKIDIITKLSCNRRTVVYMHIIYCSVLYLDTIILRVLAFVKNSMQRFLWSGSVETFSFFALVMQGDFHSPWKRVASNTRDTIPNAMLNQPTQRNWSTVENWATSALTPARRIKRSYCPRVVSSPDFPIFFAL